MTDKLKISQIMNLANKIEHVEWISTLISMNNNGQIEKFLKMINKSDWLNTVLQNDNKQNKR